MKNSKHIKKQNKTAKTKQMGKNKIVCVETTNLYIPNI